MILLIDSEGPDQTARMRRLILVFVVCICPKTRFRLTRPPYILNIATELLGLPIPLRMSIGFACSPAHVCWICLVHCTCLLRLPVPLRMSVVFSTPNDCWVYLFRCACLLGLPFHCTGLFCLPAPPRMSVGFTCSTAHVCWVCLFHRVCLFGLPVQLRMAVGFAC